MEKLVNVLLDGSTELWLDGALLTTVPPGGDVEAAVAAVFPSDPLPPLAAWRFEAALMAHGLGSAVDAAIAAMPQPAQSIAKAKRARVVQYERDDPLFTALAPAVGMTSEQLDALWREALTY